MPWKSMLSYQYLFVQSYKFSKESICGRMHKKEGFSPLPHPLQQHTLHVFWIGYVSQRSSFAAIQG